MIGVIKVLKYLLLFLLIPYICFSFPNTPVLDSFNRTNTDPIDGIWSNSVFGGAASVGCAIVSNVAVRAGSTPNEGCWVTNATPSSTGVQEVYATLTNGTSMIVQALRLFACLQGGVGSTAVDGYAVGVQKVDADTDIAWIDQVDNGNNYTRFGANFAQEFDDGDKYGLEVVGDGTLNFWYDGGSGWSILFSRTDATPFDCTDTNIGMFPRSTTTELDDFGGGNIPIVSESTYVPSVITFK